VASLRTLHPAFRPYAEDLYRFAQSLDNSFVVTSARRSHAEQSQLYNRFLRGESGGLPALPPGRSLHEYGFAFDLARPGIRPQDDSTLANLGGLWRMWGGRWSDRDPVHFQP